MNVETKDIERRIIQNSQRKLVSTKEKTQNLKEPTLHGKIMK